MIVLFEYCNLPNITTQVAINTVLKGIRYGLVYTDCRCTDSRYLSLVHHATQKNSLFGVRGND